MKKTGYLYPFCGIVGQEEMKRALILNIINPLIGGVLIRGEKGTAKSTAVRALTDLLPLREQVEGCRFSCDPQENSHWCEECRRKNDEGMALKKIMGKMKVVNLPLSATEDRVVGSLDIEHAIKQGEKKFELGILAEANRNILYVDEVNLLEDHVVDILLDAAAMGANTIEREGISYSHPSSFVLVGSMNPEEGDLRPQLLDRFGLVVDVYGEEDPDLRVEVVERRLAFEADAEGFIAGYKEAERQLGERIKRAQERLRQVSYSKGALRLAAEISIELGVDGHRGDITLIKTALTHAAYMDRTAITKEDLLVAARLSLPHRMRRRPFEEGRVDFDTIYELIEKAEL